MEGGKMRLYDGPRSRSQRNQDRDATAPTAVRSGVSKAARKRSKRRKTPRGVREFYWLDEVADRLGLSERTLQRDINDGVLIASMFRGSLRISERDLQIYIRKSRGLTVLSKRRRSPRKAKSKTKRDGQ
jgi:excisionase family DNA binding protein